MKSLILKKIEQRKIFGASASNNYSSCLNKRQNEYISKTYDDDNETASDSDTASLSDYSSNTVSLNGSNSDNAYHKRDKKLKKNVSFSTTNAVYLIPVKTSASHSDLWYTLHQIRTFKTEAFEQVKEYRSSSSSRYGTAPTSGCTVKEAMTALYQPPSTVASNLVVIAHEDKEDDAIPLDDNSGSSNSDHSVSSSNSNVKIDDDWLQSTLDFMFDDNGATATSISPLALSPADCFGDCSFIAYESSNLCDIISASSNDDSLYNSNDISMIGGFDYAHEYRGNNMVTLEAPCSYSELRLYNNNHHQQEQQDDPLFLWSDVHLSSSSSSITTLTMMDDDE